ncbi:MAG: phosphatase PAP2 family protein [Woeseiaceae bacterium]|nr:phosphatase PAP2 family protein [Woeseiaceae bacterium]
MQDVIAYFDHVESGICLRINRLSHRRLARRFFSIVSKLGDGGAWVVMVAVLYAKRGHDFLPSVALIAVTAGIGVLIYSQLKNRLVRERPYINHGDILCGAAPLDRYSFPSGHTLHAVSFTIMLAAVEPQMLFIAVPFALLVAASRVILGLHYPSDVFAGGVLGAILASVSLTLFRAFH